MKRGYAKVFDGNDVALDLPGDIIKSPRRIKMTKDQFVKAWNSADSTERRRLMKVVIPVDNSGNPI